MPAPAHTPRTISGLAGGPGVIIRRAKFDGTEYIIVPVVCAIGNMVVWPMSATGWELVPEEELAAYPVGWNFRPILPDHPHGGALSANDPATLESLRFGYMFGTRYVNGALQTEAWLDPIRAKQVGPAAESVVARVLAGELVEVSVGAGIISDPTSGTTSDGREYSSVWRDIIPDHLAMLPAGAIGACSVEMGCGAPRSLRESRASEARQAQIAILRGDTNMPDPTTAAPALAQPVAVNALSSEIDAASKRHGIANVLRAVSRGLASIGVAFRPASMAATSEIAAAAGDTSYNEMYDALWTLLYNNVGAFGGIIDIWPDSQRVVYSVYLADSNSADDFYNNEKHYYQRTYALGDAGNPASLNDDAIEVMRDPVYRPVAASGARHSKADQTMVQEMHDTAVALGADCSPDKSTTTTTTTASASPCGCHKETDMPLPQNVKDAMARQIKGAATDEDRKLLAQETGIPVEELTPKPASPIPVTEPATPAIAAQGAAPAPTAPATAPVAAKSPEELEREWLASNPPPHLVAMADAFKRAEGEQRVALAAEITGATAEYKAEELARMPLPELERLSRALGASPAPLAAGPSFLGRPFPSPAGGAAEVNRRRYEGPMARAARAKQGGSAGPDAPAN